MKSIDKSHIRVYKKVGRTIKGKHSFSSLTFFSTALVAAALFIGAITVFALPYLPGAQLNPTCAPGSSNCTVAVEPATINFTPITFTDSPYTLLTDDQVLHVDTTAGAVTINLPSLNATNLVSKRTVIIAKTDGDYPVYINSATGDTINQTTSITLSEINRSVKLESILGTTSPAVGLWAGSFNFDSTGVSPLSVRVATTTALPAENYNNGASGVGATLTATSSGILPAIDGVTVVVGDRILVKDQVAKSENGVYVVTADGSAGNYVLTRTSDADATAEFDPQIVIATEGAVGNRGVQYGQQTSIPVIGTDNIVYGVLGLGVTQEVAGTQVAGQIPFYTGTPREISKGGNKFVWDSTNSRLGVGTSVLTSTLQLKGNNLGDPSLLVNSPKNTSLTSNSGDGGRIGINGGAGADADVSTNAGKGGRITMISGVGGDSATTKDGGNGGRMAYKAGAGGDSTGGIAGKGGEVGLTAGKGGAGSTNGSGGSIVLNSGDPGGINTADNPQLLSTGSGDILLNPYFEVDTDGGGPTVYHARDRNVGIGVDVAPSAKLDVLENKIMDGSATSPSVATVGLKVNNSATDTTAGLNKIGVRISNTGSYAGDNHGIYIDDVTGGATNTGITIRNGNTMTRVIDAPETGAYLSNTGVWTDASSKTRKENYEKLDNTTLLQKIASLAVEKWNYITDHNDNIKHIGPYAEDVYNEFGVGDDSKTLAPLDTAGIALAGVKALNEKIDNVFVANAIAGIDELSLALRIGGLLEKLGVSIVDGVIKAKSLIASVIQADKVVTNSFEMKDSVDGKTYCVTLKNGEFNKVVGVCR